MRYLIPKKRATAETKVKNSRFIATLEHVTSTDQAKDFLAAMRQTHPGANHHVYAFKIGYGASVTEGMSDDGEPSGTSGPPVMAVLRGSGLGDAILVVTRFFGGTKLGTGGLVSAYKQAAQAVIAAASTIEKVELERISFCLDYALLDQVRRAYADYELTELEAEYGAQVKILASIAAERLPDFEDYLRQASAGRCQVSLHK